MSESGCDDKGVPSQVVQDWLFDVYEKSVGIIAGVFTDCGLSPERADHCARACLARLANAKPPISVELLRDDPDPEPLEKVTITHWQVVNDQNGGITFDTNSRDDGRWGITKANEWLERMRGYGGSYHLEVWEQTYRVTPDTWRRVS